MEISFDTLINILSLLLGGGGGAFFVWRYQRKKAKAEASQAEASAAKELQDMYQQMIADAKSDREDRKAQNDELRQERDHYKQDRNDIRQKMEQLTRSFMDWRLEADNDRSRMKMDIARLGRKVEAMRPFLCADLKCKKRKLVAISDIEDAKTGQESASATPEPPALPCPNDIEPIESDAL